MRIIKCDRCKKEITGAEKAGYVNLDYRDTRSGNLEGRQSFEDWDLCDNCMDEIEKFIRKIVKPAAAAETKKSSRSTQDGSGHCTRPAGA